MLNSRVPSSDAERAERLDAIAQWLPPLMYGLIIAAALL